MKIFITGINGQLGYAVAHKCLQQNYTVGGCGTALTCAIENAQYYRADITNTVDIRQAILDFNPDVVIHCAAWTAVDNAEKEENRYKVYEINTIGTYNITLATRIIDAKLVYISTDYVFNGKGELSWTPQDECNPLNIYGFTKWRGERMIQSYYDKYFIIRISWLFGLNGNNFVDTMLKLSENHTTLTVINDQIGRPTYTNDLATLICEMILTNKYGIYHVSNEGEYISWADFATAIFKEANKDIKIIPVSTEEYNNQTKANRPKNSRFDTSKIELNGFNKLPTWHDALRRYLWEKQI